MIIAPRVQTTQFKSAIIKNRTVSGSIKCFEHKLM
jgi:hypothetical protein